VQGENLGTGNNTDFLAISLSSTDLIGHQFGPNSIESEDCFLRLDKDLGDFFSFLDARLGKDNYLVFLTADHGAAHAEGFLEEKQIPGGSFNIDSVTGALNILLYQKLGPGAWILSHENMQFYLNRSLMAEKGISSDAIFNICRPYMLNFPAVADLIDLKNLSSTSLQPGLKTTFANGNNIKRSGDFQILYNPSWVEGFAQGATHGTPYAYDTHIPLLWMGWKIKPGADNSPAFMTDIAPTLASLLHIQEPSGCVGKPIVLALHK
jgi:arylsulfatase A-like enzyme